MKKAELRARIEHYANAYDTVCDMLNERRKRITELEKENAQLKSDAAWWEETAGCISDSVAKLGAEVRESKRSESWHKLTIDDLEEEVRDAYAKEKADSIRISDLMRERDGWQREYNELKTRYDLLSTEWTRLNRNLGAWDEINREGP